MLKLHQRLVWDTTIPVSGFFSNHSFLFHDSRIPDQQHFIGSITCFIMYSQLIIICNDHIAGGDNFDINNIILTASPNSKLLLKILLTFMTSVTFVSFATLFHHFASVLLEEKMEPKE